MLQNKIWQKSLQRAWTLKLLGLIGLIGAGFGIWATISSGENREFAAADDFPRGALVYAQFRDLPALIKTWDDSELKKNYLASENYKQFQNRHLALKLAARRQEFNDALGFEIDTGAIAGTSDNQAAIAIYDIGKMEMVFVAPVSAAKFAASMFFQNQAKFKLTTLPDKTVYYSRDVAADRGRQPQKIVFANAGGRFVLATSENLLLRTLANINQKTGKDFLSAEPAFAELSSRLTPHLATVWVDQTKLNADWYFKHYWVMRNVNDLNGLRAGIFDFEMRGEQIIERREFLLTENNEPDAQKVSAAEAAFLKSFIPADAPYYRLRTAADKPEQTGVLLREMMLDRLPPSASEKSGKRWNAYDYFDKKVGSGAEDDYDYLGSRFDELIDEADNDTAAAVGSGAETEKLTAKLSEIFTVAQAASVITAASPRNLDAPLFVRFEKSLICRFNSPQTFDSAGLENAISTIITSDLKVKNQQFDLTWSDQNDGRNTWRALKLPLSNRGIYYAVRDDTIVIANSAEFLQAIQARRNSVAEAAAAAPAEIAAAAAADAFDELSVIRLDQRATAFDAPMSAIYAEEKKSAAESKAVPAADFFTGDIGSLLTVVNRARQIEIKRNSAAKFMSVEIIVTIPEK